MVQPLVTKQRSTTEDPFDRQQRREICDLQLALVTDGQMEPPTLFEYLGLDVTQYPFTPFTAFTSPGTGNYAAATRAILKAYITVATSLSPGVSWKELSPDAKAAFETLRRVVVLLIQDSLRQMYVETFLVRLAGPKHQMSINGTQGRRNVLEDLCKDDQGTT